MPGVRTNEMATRAATAGSRGGDVLGRSALADPLSNSGGSPLPPALKSSMEASHGADFGSVKLHVGDAPTKLGADAVTKGEHVHVASSSYDPSSAAGKAVIGHELGHVMQQRRGEVPASPSGMNVDAGLEASAERMGQRAASGTAEPATSSRATGVAPDNGAMQFSGLTHPDFVTEVRRRNLAGLCNALTASWLGGLINPEVDDDDSTMGVSLRGVDRLEHLKAILDGLSEDRNLPSSAATDLFLDYMKSRDAQSWFMDLRANKIRTERAALVAHYDRDDDSGDDDESDDDDAAFAAHDATLAEAPYADLGHPVIADFIKAMLDPRFDPAVSFQGMIIVNARGGEGEFANHQLGIKYVARRQNLEIFDQTTGLMKDRVHDADELADRLAQHLWPNYVGNPMEIDGVPTTAAQFRFGLRPAT